MNIAAPDEVLVPFGIEEIATARRLAASRQSSVVAALDELASVPPEVFVARLGAALHYPVATMQDLHAWTPAFDLLPFAESVRAQVVLFRDGADALRLVFGDPFAGDRLPWAEERVAEPFMWTLAHHADVAAYLSRYEETLSAVESLLPSASSAAAGTSGIEDLSYRSITEDSSQVVKLVRSTLYDALKTGASDIHLETSATGLAIKYRIDGVLVAIGSLSGLELAEQVISRVKVMAELDIAERRVPQDGRFKVSARGREIDFRVSVMPSIFGEDAVLRILDKQRLADEVRGLTLDSLGFDEPRESADSQARQRTLRDVARHWTDRQRQDDNALRYDHRDQPWPRQDRHHRRPSRVSTGGSVTDPRERKEGSHLRAGICVRSCVTTPTGSWSARSATAKPRRSRFRPRSPGTSCSPPCMRTTCSTCSGVSPTWPSIRTVLRRL